MLALTSESEFHGQVNPSQVAALMKEENISRDELMLKLLPIARKHAHPPLSNYFVGAVALGTSGALYLGQNIEIPGNMLGLAVHAEQSPIANADMAGEREIQSIAVTGAPCGHCRQFLAEVSAEINLQVLVPNASPMQLAELLPKAFGPKALGVNRGAFPAGDPSWNLVHNATGDLAQQALRTIRQRILLALYKVSVWSGHAHSFRKDLSRFLH